MIHHLPNCVFFRFVEQKTVEIETSKNQNRINDSLNITDFNRNPDTQTKTVFTRPSVDGTFGIHTSGPILRLPVETCVMRVCSSEPQRKGCRSPSPSKSKEREVIAKLTEVSLVLGIPRYDLCINPLREGGGVIFSNNRPRTAVSRLNIPATLADNWPLVPTVLSAAQLPGTRCHVW